MIKGIVTRKELFRAVKKYLDETPNNVLIKQLKAIKRKNDKKIKSQENKGG